MLSYFHRGEGEGIGTPHEMCESCNLSFAPVDLYYIGEAQGIIGALRLHHLQRPGSELMHGCVLGINADCSHSGSWVRECRTFLDEQGVRPCGHSARDKGILMTVYTSSLSKEVPRRLAFSVHGC